jgi:hypothetical protein
VVSEVLIVNGKDGEGKGDSTYVNSTLTNTVDDTSSELIVLAISKLSFTLPRQQQPKRGDLIGASSEAFFSVSM